ncbi:MAG: nickel pincer cofactor biosynthesis protein LarC, partial [Frankia sp.]|nr:nickel pincer cofactor biosynthesis protein LarC [Frankia sp.]
MLTSCAPGVAVCNIDNGFGAGLFAARVARAAAGARTGQAAAPAAIGPRPSAAPPLPSSTAASPAVAGGQETGAAARQGPDAGLAAAEDPGAGGPVDIDPDAGEGTGAAAGASAAAVAVPVRRPASTSAGEAGQPRRIGWLDLSCGASGDMLLGALVDAGVPIDVLAGAVAALGLPVRLDARRVRRAGLAATKVDVIAEEPASHRRTWRDIRALLAAAPLDPAVGELATAVFAALADAEARVHGSDPAQVHFHEVGALDAIADVVGTCAGLVHLGLAELVASPLALGGGQARTEHGLLPVPGPAVLELLRASAAPAVGGPVPVELCTPTGAALVVTAATSFGPLPALRVSAVGSGAGSRDLPDRPNVVRLVVGTALPTAGTTRPTGHDRHAHARHRQRGHGGHDHLSDDNPHDHDAPHPADAAGTGQRAAPGRVLPVPATVSPGLATAGGIAATATDELVLETNVDDLDPRVWPSVLAALLAAGAVDAWLTPVVMKKGRPAHTLAALVPPERAAAVRNEIFRHTTTLGVREYPVRKYARARDIRVVDVAGHPVRVKITLGDEDGPAAGVAQPEWEDVARVAELLAWPARRVLAIATAHAHDGRWRDPAPAPRDDHQPVPRPGATT